MATSFPARRWSASRRERNRCRGCWARFPAAARCEFEWMGSGYTLTASSKLSDHERRLLRSIGMVLSARYQLLTNEELAAQSFQLFRGLPEDRFVSAFLDPTPHASAEAIAEIPDRVADSIEVLRTSSMSTYENRRIATGVLLFGSMPEPCHVPPETPQQALRYSHQLTSIRSFHRLCDGLRTLALVDQNGMLAELIDVHEWSEPYRDMPLGRAAVGDVHRSLPRDVVRRPHLPDPVAQRRDQDLRRRRAGVPLHRRQMAAGGRASSLRTVEERHRQCGTGRAPVRGGAEPYREPARRAVRRARQSRVGVAIWYLKPDLLDHLQPRCWSTASPARTNCIICCATRAFSTCRPRCWKTSRALTARWCFAPTPICWRSARSCIINSTEEAMNRTVEGGRTTAAIAASHYGTVLKISEDGLISMYRGGQCLWEM